MAKYIDKKALWTQVLNTLELMVTEPSWNFLQVYYLDSIEKDIAVIAAPSDFMRTQFGRCYLDVVKLAFKEVMGKEITIRTALGHQQVQEQYLAPGPTLTGDLPKIGSVPGMDDEVAIMLDKYGDIMGIVDHHPLFVKATNPKVKGGWEIWPQVLTNACKDCGIGTVLKSIRFTANRKSVMNPRAFLLTILEKGQFGNPYIRPKYDRALLQKAN